MNENLQHDQQGAEFRADPTGGLLRTAETPPIALVMPERSSIPDPRLILETPAGQSAETPATNAPTPETSPDVAAGLREAEDFANDPANATEAAPAAPGTPEAAEQAEKQKRFRRTRRALKIARTVALINVATAIII